MAAAEVVQAAVEAAQVVVAVLAAVAVARVEKVAAMVAALAAVEVGQAVGVAAAMAAAVGMARRMLRRVTGARMLTAMARVMGVMDSEVLSLKRPRRPPMPAKKPPRIRGSVTSAKP